MSSEGRGTSRIISFGSILNPIRINNQNLPKNTDRNSSVEQFLKTDDVLQDEDIKPDISSLSIASNPNSNSNHNIQIQQYRSEIATRDNFETTPVFKMECLEIAEPKMEVGFDLFSDFLNEEKNIEEIAENPVPDICREKPKGDSKASLSLTMEPPPPKRKRGRPFKIGKTKKTKATVNIHSYLLRKTKKAILKRTIEPLNGPSKSAQSIKATTVLYKLRNAATEKQQKVPTKYEQTKNTKKPQSLPVQKENEPFLMEQHFESPHEDFDVERIVDVREFSGKREYLVMYWIPEAKLGLSKNKIDKFNKEWEIIKASSTSNFCESFDPEENASVTKSRKRTSETEEIIDDAHVSTPKRTKLMKPISKEDERKEFPWSKVLCTILKYLDVKDLKSSRRVSQIWNKAVLPILSKKTSIKLEPRKKIKPNANVERLKKLYSTLQNSPNASQLFRNIRNYIFVGNKVWMNLCSDFGENVQNLSISLQRQTPKYLGENYSECQNLLTKSLTSLFPNVKSFSFKFAHKLQDSSSEENENFQKNISSWEVDKILKLEEVILEECGLSCSLVTIKWIISVLRNSTGLKKLKMIDMGYRDVEIYESLLVATEVIGKTLEEFYCDSVEVRDLSASEENQENPFLKFLGSLNNLKKLTLSGSHTFHAISKNRLTYSKYLCSEMRNNLTHMELTNFFFTNYLYPDEIPRFIHSFANLKYLKVTENDMVVPRCTFSIGIIFLKENPLVNLKRLTIRGTYVELKTKEIVQDFVKTFPNLEHLDLDVNVYRNVSSKSKSFLWIMDGFHLVDIFPLFSQLKMLKIFNFAARTWDKPPVGRLLRMLPTFQKLESFGLDLLRDVQKPELFTFEMLAKPLEIIRHLKSIQLVKNHIKLKDWEKVEEFAVANDIRLTLI